MVERQKHKLSLIDYKNSPILRKKYLLFRCPDRGRMHLLDLMPPPKIGKKKTRFEWYDIDYRYIFKRSLAGERVQLCFKCMYCEKFHYTTPKVCKKCLKVIKPISKKLEPRLLIIEMLKCKCYAKR